MTMKKRVHPKVWQRSLNKKGQITLPRAWLRRIGIHPGDTITVEVNKDEIVITRAEAAVGLSD